MSICALGTPERTRLVRTASGRSNGLMRCEDWRLIGIMAPPTVRQRSTYSFSGSMTNGGAETIYIADAGNVPPAAIDLSLTKIASSAGGAVVGSSLTYLLTATNNGPNAATSVVVTDTLPASLNIISFNPSQGTCTRQGALMTCALGTIDILQTATVQIIVIPTAAGSVTNTASVTAAQADTVVANNAATLVTQISAAPVVLPAVPPTPIPTLTAWALAILGAAVALTALVRRRR